MAENNHPLAKWRAEKGITQEALAGKLGVASVTVWRWEHGKRDPRRKDLEQISKVTGLSASQILGMEAAQ